MAEEDPQSLGQVGAVARPRGEDELPMGEGEQQLLIEVLREQECSLLAAGGTEAA